MASSKNAPKRNFVTYLGAIFLLLGLGILGNLFGPVAREEIRYQQRTFVRDEEDHEYSCPPGDFQIYISQLNLCANIIPNVDPLDSRVYQRALTRGVAHAAGTGLPGEGRNIFLFAHSSGNPLDAARYNSIFYLLYKLTPGDPINVTYLGQTHRYLVQSLTKVAPTQVAYLDPLSDGETLTLMTCWPPGTTFKRLIVVAKPDAL